MTMFDTIIIGVIGAGPIGSAAARYLSKLTDNVAIIGAAEPEIEETHTGVFASHYDQRRLTRLSGRTKLWVDIAKHATEQISYLEENSGLSFFEPIGVLLVKADHLKDKYIESPLETLDASNIVYTHFPTGDGSWREHFPDYDFPESHWILAEGVLHEGETAGMLDPRKLVRAQLEVAQQSGTTVIRNQVSDLKEKDNSVEIICTDGSSYQAKKVIVATGAFTNICNLLPKPVALTLKTETVILGEVSAEDAQRLKTIPTVSYSIDHPKIHDIYLTPPAHYADGKNYFKMGANTFADQFPESLEEVQRWFQSGDSDVSLSALQEGITSILPKVNFLSFKTKRCIISRTANGYPMIDQVSSRLFVAVGGNGVGVKTSDTLGYLAAGLSFDGGWDQKFDRAPFKAVYKK